jgi:drug/metabolite transporter superfamily protein YnfA
MSEGYAVDFLVAEVYHTTGKSIPNRLAPRAAEGYIRIDNSGGLLASTGCPPEKESNMSYHDIVGKLAGDPQQLEQVYRSALEAGQADAFKQAIEAGQAAAPDNLLYGAWFYRLQDAAVRAKDSFIRWGWVLPLALLNGLVFWLLSDDDRFTVQIQGLGLTLDTNYFPTLILLAAPIAALFILIYLAATGWKKWRSVAVIGAILTAATAYVFLLYPRLGTKPFQEQYLTLMALHLPLLAWAGVGAYLVAGHRDPENRFAFLVKSLEVFIMGGLFIIAGGLFTAITVGLFDALSVEFPEMVQRLFIAGGAGLIPVLATAVIYNPTESPAGQSFDEGLSKLVALLMRILLPLTLIVLVVYLAFIPFNFREPFDNRDVLIIYNAMLFAVIALLVGATPISLAELSPAVARWLRWGIIAVSTLALVVSIYALAAIVYRTAIDRLTPNRLTFIGWNVINIGLLILILVFQARAKSGQWLRQLYRAFSAGTVAYGGWTLVVILSLPWLFSVDQMDVEGLPPSIQTLIYHRPSPILLKCAQSPHIYLLEGGQKRWINTIETFEDRGYVWRDVQFVTCDALRSVPNGEPIPTDAGPPPQP